MHLTKSSSISSVSYLIDGSHEANIIRNGIVQVGLEEYIHIGIDTTTNQQHTVPEKISLESTCLSSKQNGIQ